MPAKNLLTGYPARDLVQPCADYGFEAPKVEMVPNIVERPASIYWVPAAALPQVILYGKADQHTQTADEKSATKTLTLCWPAKTKGWNAAENQFSFVGRGHIEGSISEMRSKFSDDVIKAAFKDLTTKALEADQLPENCDSWTANPVSRVELTTGSSATEDASTSN